MAPVGPTLSPAVAYTASRSANAVRSTRRSAIDWALNRRRPTRRSPNTSDGAPCPPYRFARRCAFPCTRQSHPHRQAIRPASDGDQPHRTPSQRDQRYDVPDTNAAVCAAIGRGRTRRRCRSGSGQHPRGSEIRQRGATCGVQAPVGTAASCRQVAGGVGLRRSTECRHPIRVGRLSLPLAARTATRAPGSDGGHQRLPTETPRRIPQARPRREPGQHPRVKKTSTT